MSKRKHRRSGIYWCDRRQFWIIDKGWKGKRIYYPTYSDNPDDAESLLDAELEKLRTPQLHGDTPLSDIHDNTLKPYIRQRIRKGVMTRTKDKVTGEFYTSRRDIKYTSINRELEVMRTILMKVPQISQWILREKSQ